MVVVDVDVVVAAVAIGAVVVNNGSPGFGPVNRANSWLGFGGALLVRLR